MTTTPENKLPHELPTEVELSHDQIVAAIVEYADRHGLVRPGLATVSGSICLVTGQLVATVHWKGTVHASSTPQ